MHISTTSVRILPNNCFTNLYKARLIKIGSVGSAVAIDKHKTCPDSRLFGVCGGRH